MFLLFLILLVLLAGFGFISRDIITAIKIVALICVDLALFFVLWLMTFSLAPAVRYTIWAVVGLFLVGMAWGMIGLILEVSAARRNPDKYAIPGAHCAACGGLVMHAKYSGNGKDGLTHIFLKDYRAVGGTQGHTVALVEESA